MGDWQAGQIKTRRHILWRCEEHLPFAYRIIHQIKKTRTHSMARHRKSPRSRRNLMVIDSLTPSQGHQFDHRLNFFSPSWSTAHPLKFDIPHDHVQKITFLTSPQGPRGWGPKNCAGACAFHVRNSHTKYG